MSHSKKCTRQMISFEIRNITGNPSIHIFGIGLPVFLAILIGKSIEAEIPDLSILSHVQTAIILSMGTIIPLATILMGYACQYSQELEKGVPLRMILFGYQEKYTIINRIIAEFIFITIACAIYFAVVCNVFKLETPAFTGVLLYFVTIYVLSAILFILAHAIASIIKKFGPTYAVVMILYFGIMIISGMMGLETEQLPTIFQKLAKLLPFVYYQSDFVTIWQGESYNFAPMLQSFLFLGAASGILLFFAIRKTSRKIQ